MQPLTERPCIDEIFSKWTINSMQSMLLMDVRIRMITSTSSHFHLNRNSLISIDDTPSYRRHYQRKRKQQEPRKQRW